MNKQEHQYKLIKKIKESNDSSSYKELLSDYEPLIKSISYDLCNKFKETPIERDGLENVLSFALFQLVKEYDEGKGMSFPSYVKTFLKYKGINYLRLYITNGHKALNYYDSEKVHETHTIEENNSELKDFLKITKLSRMEAAVISDMLEGFSLKEITIKTGKSKQTIYAAKKRGLEKIKKNMESVI